MKRTKLSLLVMLCTLALLFCSVAAQAATIHVVHNGAGNKSGSNWANAKDSIQAAITAAVSGDEVWVAAGTYSERITLKQGVSVYGGFAGTETSKDARVKGENGTILNGSGGSIVSAGSTITSATVIDGFTITNGSATNGGGIYCSSSSPVISNNIITGNTASASGGGIYCSNASPTIRNNTVKSNQSNTFGGGIEISGGTPYISHNVIDGNSAINTTNGNGGGIHIANGVGETTIANNVIVNNRAKIAPGICASYSNVLIVNNTIAHNGLVGVALTGGGVVVSGNTSNTAKIYNNIIAFNKPYGIQKQSVTIALGYNLMCDNIDNNGEDGNYHGLSQADLNNPLFPTNIIGDPLFTTDGTYHIPQTSPCYNSGDNSAPGVSGITLDIDGYDRILDTTIDRGADEWCSLRTTSITVTSKSINHPSIANFDDIVNLSFTISGALASGPFVTINGNSVTAKPHSGNNYTCTYTVGAEDPDGPATIKITGKDADGNDLSSVFTDKLVVGDPEQPNDPKKTYKVDITIDPTSVKNMVSPELIGGNTFVTACTNAMVNTNPSGDSGFTGDILPSMITASSDLGVSVMRYPGGAFAETYHWRYGVGPINNRGNQQLISDSNYPYTPYFGTDEYVKYCDQLTKPAKKMITVNYCGGVTFVSGKNYDPAKCKSYSIEDAAQEAANWVEYCNVEVTQEILDSASSEVWQPSIISANNDPHESADSVHSWCSYQKVPDIAPGKSRYYFAWLRYYFAIQKWLKDNPTYTETTVPTAVKDAACQPYDVKYWEIGNEILYRYELAEQSRRSAVGYYDEDGVYKDGYSDGVIEFSRRMKSVDPTIKIGAVMSPATRGLETVNPDKSIGVDQLDWNGTVINVCKDSIDFVVPHYYNSFYQLTLDYPGPGNKIYELGSYSTEPGSYSTRKFRVPRPGTYTVRVVARADIIPDPRNSQGEWPSDDVCAKLGWDKNLWDHWKDSDGNYHDDPGYHSDMVNKPVALHVLFDCLPPGSDNPPYILELSSGQDCNINVGDVNDLHGYPPYGCPNFKTHTLPKEYAFNITVSETNFDPNQEHQLSLTSQGNWCAPINTGSGLVVYNLTIEEEGSNYKKYFWFPVDTEQQMLLFDNKWLGMHFDKLQEQINATGRKIDIMPTEGNECDDNFAIHGGPDATNEITPTNRYKGAFWIANYLNMLVEKNVPVFCPWNLWDAGYWGMIRDPKSTLSGKDAVRDTTSGVWKKGGAEVQPIFTPTYYLMKMYSQLVGKAVVDTAISPETPPMPTFKYPEAVIDLGVEKTDLDGNMPKTDPHYVPIPPFWPRWVHDFVTDEDNYFYGEPYEVVDGKSYQKQRPKDVPYLDMITCKQGNWLYMIVSNRTHIPAKATINVGATLAGTDAIEFEKLYIKEDNSDTQPRNTWVVKNAHHELEAFNDDLAVDSGGIQITPDVVVAEPEPKVSCPWDTFDRTFGPYTITLVKMKLAGTDNSAPVLTVSDEPANGFVKSGSEVTLTVTSNQMLDTSQTTVKINGRNATLHREVVDSQGNYIYKYLYKISNTDPEGNATISVNGKDVFDVSTTMTATSSFCIDRTPPTTPIVAANGTGTPISGLHATWVATDERSAISEISYAVGTTNTVPNSPDGLVVKWTSTTNVSPPEITQPVDLIAGTIYYIYVAAKDVAGNWSAVGVTAVGKGIVYVKPDGDDAKDGLSWSQAKKTISDGLSTAALLGKDVWVAAGTYKGSSQVPSIILKDGVGLYGGFAGTEAFMSQRNIIANKTVLDGNQAGSVVVADSVGPNTVIDGFNIINGKGNTNVNLNGDLHGGGIYCHNAAPVISHNNIAANTVSGYGAGICCDNSDGISTFYPTITDNIIRANFASRGGGIYCNGKEIIVNNTIICNSEGIYYEYSLNDGLSLSTNISNNIIAFNSSGIGMLLSPTLSYNCIYNPAEQSPTEMGVNYINEDPELAEEENGWAHLKEGSPCINAGLDRASGLPLTDIDGNVRTIGTVDMGADEYGGTVSQSQSINIVRVSKTSGVDDTQHDGSSWALAKQTVQAGIDTAYALGGGEVWVKAETYYERVNLKPYVHMYGGFVGTETEKTARAWWTNTTNIDGEYRGVVITAKLCQYGTIDGFTLRNARGDDYNNKYDVISCINSSPMISHNIVTGMAMVYDEYHHPLSTFNGGIYCYTSSPVIANNLICENSLVAFNHGGGICCVSNSSPLIINNTITNNSVADDNEYLGGGIYCGDYCFPKIIGNIIVNNSNGIVGGLFAAPVIQDNCVYNPGRYNYFRVTEGIGNISSAPMFVATGGYHLGDGSPCINNGPISIVLPVDKDLDGNPRTNGRVDMGAYERQ